MFRRGLWSNRDFLRLWSGQTVSVFGSFVGQLALQFTAVLWLDASAGQVAILALCQLVPGFVISPLAGAWADRVPRRNAMVAADFGRFLALGTIPVAALLDGLGILHLFAVALVVSVLDAVFEVAYRAILPGIVQAPQLIEGNSKLSASEAVAEAAAFGSGGWLVQLLTAPGAVFVDAVTFAWSAWRLAGIRADSRPPHSSMGRLRLRDDLLDGLRFVARQPTVRTIALANGLLALAAQVIGVVLLLYLARDVGFAPGVLGLVFAVGGLTALSGAGLAARLEGRVPLRLLLVLTLAGVAAGQGFIPLATSTSLAGIVLLVASQLVTDPCWTIYAINEVSLRQAITPSELLGRVTGLVRGSEGAGRLAGAALGGILGEAIGFRETLFVAAGLSALAPILVLLSSPGRATDATVAPSGAGPGT